MEITYKFFMIRHGLPTATTLAGMSFVTTLPAPITVTWGTLHFCRTLTVSQITDLVFSGGNYFIIIRGFESFGFEGSNPRVFYPVLFPKFK